MKMDINRYDNLDLIQSAIQDGLHPAPPADGLFEPTSVMALFLQNPEIQLLFIQKADIPGYAWANQMAFPGGHVEEDDGGSRQAALRELEEETGIVPGNVEVIGTLGHFQTLKNKDIEAWTGIWNQADEIVFDRAEIKRIFRIPLSHLIRCHTDNRYHEREVNFMQLIYPYEDVQIWGVTAKMICHMINLILNKN
mgnify:FL=1